MEGGKESGAGPGEGGAGSSRAAWLGRQGGATPFPNSPLGVRVLCHVGLSKWISIEQ